MAIPSGSGTEVIKSTQLQGVSTTATDIITGVSNHIYIVVSIIITEAANQSGKDFFIGLFDSDGTSNETIVKAFTPIGAKQTFVWNDRFSFTGNKKLRVKSNPAADLDVICTYIDQDWS